MDSTLPPSFFTVGTYNILLPHYAVKWKEPEGHYKGLLGSDNWPHRKIAVYQTLVKAWLDVFFLQEIGPNELTDIYRDELKASYSCVFATHPARKDGLAILWKNEKFSQNFNFTLNHQNGHISLFVNVNSKDYDHPFLFGSCHMDWNTESGDIQIQELLNLLSKFKSDELIFGGDFNRVKNDLTQLEQNEYISGGNENYQTRSERKIDFIFYKKNKLIKEMNHRWVDAAHEYSCEKQDYSGEPPSDHKMFAVGFCKNN